MTRSHHQFDCAGETLAGTLDHGEKTTGLLIVSGGNEIRSGAHAGMAKLAESMASQGYPVFRYDRRGIGESGGKNNGFLGSQEDIVEAAKKQRSLCPNINQLVAFGNCDAATALAIFGNSAGIDALILANPWVIEDGSLNDGDDSPTAPPPSAIRSRYWERVKNPRTIVDLLKGKIDFRKLVTGLKQATQKQENNELTIKLRDAMAVNGISTKILLAERDSTARAFQAAWDSKDFRQCRTDPKIELSAKNTASHSFADKDSKQWLENQTLEVLNSE